MCNKFFQVMQTFEHNININSWDIEKEIIFSLSLENNSGSPLPALQLAVISKCVVCRDVKGKITENGRPMKRDVKLNLPISSMWV